MTDETCKTCKGNGRSVVHIGKNAIPNFIDCPECKGLGTFAKAEYQSTDSGLLGKSLMKELNKRTSRLEEFAAEHEGRIDRLEIYIAAQQKLNHIVKSHYDHLEAQLEMIIKILKVC
jgi:DnaJ-class molecular chaperone